MLRLVVILMILIPALEIWGFIIVGKMIGGLNTFLIILLTGLLGIYFAKREGKYVIQDVKHKMMQGEPPGPALLDGIAVLLAAVLLFVPGFFTDVIGILLILPPTRAIFKHYLYKWIEKQIRSGNFYINGRHW